MEEIVIYAGDTLTNYELGLVILVAIMAIGGILAIMNVKIDE